MKKYRLGDIAKVDISGIDKKTKDSEQAVRLCNFTDVYYNWAITKNMYDGLMKASASESDIESFLLQRGMVVITKDSETRDDIGIAAYIADDFDDVVLGYHCALIVPKEDIPEEDRIYGKYLNALLHTKYAQKYFYNNATGSGQRYTLSKESIEDMPVYLPSYKEQVRIGDYLSDIDKKIEVNNLINSELEAMAKQIYDYWFVQFDFPNEEGKPYKSSGGKMVWNEMLKREIPDGWKESCLEQCLDFSNGINYEKDVVGDKNYRIINVRNITSSTIFINKDELDIICLPSSQADKFIVKEEDLIIARSGTPGSIRLISSPEDVIYCGFIIKGTPKDFSHKYYLMYYIKQLEGTQATNTGGSILNNVSQDTLNMVDILLPSKELLLQFNQKIEELFGLINNYQEQTNDLLRLRTFYLPLLLNGQYTIKD